MLLLLLLLLTLTKRRLRGALHKLQQLRIGREAMDLAGQQHAVTSVSDCLYWDGAELYTALSGAAQQTCTRAHRTVATKCTRAAQHSSHWHADAGLCTQKCPFDAIMIINLPKNLEKETTHRYGPNAFKLHRHVLLGAMLWMSQ